jgi:hypothetical protein
MPRLPPAARQAKERFQTAQMVLDFPDIRWGRSGSRWKRRDAFTRFITREFGLFCLYWVAHITVGRGDILMGFCVARPHWLVDNDSSL